MFVFASRMKHKIGFWLIAIALLFLVGCAKNVSTDIFRFETNILEIEVGSSRELLVTGNYHPSAEIVYTIQEGGDQIVSLIHGNRLRVEGLKEGSTRIIATIVGNELLRAVADVHVITPRASMVQIHRPAGFTDQMQIGSVVGFTATIVPENAGPVIWSTSDETKATVDQNGFLTAINGGIVSLFATSQDQKTSARIDIDIEYHPIASVQLSVAINNSAYATPANRNRAYLRETIVLQATVLPATANPAVTWSSAEPSIATVDQTGRVFGVAVGQTTIRATAADGRIASMTVVFANAPVQSVELLVANNINIVAGTAIALSASVIPSNANQAINWAIIDGNNINEFDPITNTTRTQVASLSGANLTGIYPGTITVRARSTADNTKYQDITINVLARPMPQEIVSTTTNAALRKTIEFHTSENGFTGVDNNGNEFFVFDDLITMNVSITPVQAYQNFDISIANENMLRVDRVVYNQTTQQFTIHFWVLQPGITTVTITHKYDHYYENVAPLVRTIIINEFIHEEDFDDPTSARNVTIGGIVHSYFVSGELRYFTDFLTSKYGAFEWRVGIIDGEEDAIIFSADKRFYYLKKPGTYVIEAVKDGQVIYTVSVRARNFT